MIFWPKKSLLVFWPSRKKVIGPKLQKWSKKLPKNIIGQDWHFFDLFRRSKVIFLTKQWLLVLLTCRKMLVSAKNKFWPFFGPFLQFWSNDLFLTWPKNQKWFFWPKNHFWFYERAVLAIRNMGCSNSPNTFLGILLLWPEVGDFKTWIFWTS